MTTPGKEICIDSEFCKSCSRVPPWLVINRGMVPDVLARDPKQCPVWEITGAEFSKAELHTAAGISIR